MYDFIPTNKVNGTAMDPESRKELILRALMTKQRGIYDGRNVYARKVGVVRIKGTDTYTFRNEYDCKGNEEFLFYPTTDELRDALRVYKEKGYYPYYDNDVCEYGYVQDMAQIRGEWVIRHTIWL